MRKQIYTRILFKIKIRKPALLKRILVERIEEYLIKNKYQKDFPAL